MQLSKRLEAVARLADTAKRLADVGTDHGHLPIALMESGQLEHAIAMDINRGPLAHARENIEQHGLSGRIETRLSDGVQALEPGEADTVVVAGMGGALMGKILLDGETVLRSVDTLVLQPQSEIGWFRRFLHERGYRITAEDMVKEDGKYYPMMRVEHGEQESWSDTEYQYGSYLLKSHHQVLKEFLEKEEHIYTEIAEKLQRASGERTAERLREVKEKLRVIARAKEEIQ
ncbi:MAG: class I SAM-dependent methyltransferase [Eubacteriales bacterium]|nr:class I SAM-dependent methyltransferase [Eubacteriales bacterium]